MSEMLLVLLKRFAIILASGVIDAGVHDRD